MKPFDVGRAREDALEVAQVGFGCGNEFQRGHRGQMQIFGEGSYKNWPIWYRIISHEVHEDVRFFWNWARRLPDAQFHVMVGIFTP